jgi:hypothetical protein
MTMRGNVRRGRKEIDRDIMRRAAMRKIGEENAYLIAFGPSIARAVGFALLALGAVWVWFNVDHRTIGFVAGVLGAIMLVSYFASTIDATSPQKRMMSRATGQRTRPRWWHGVGIAGALLLGLAYLALPL